jgi:hypothetical protein
MEKIKESQKVNFLKKNAKQRNKKNKLEKRYVNPVNFSNL